MQSNRHNIYKDQKKRMLTYADKYTHITMEL